MPTIICPQCREVITVEYDIQSECPLCMALITYAELSSGGTQSGGSNGSVHFKNGQELFKDLLDTALARIAELEHEVKVYERAFQHTLYIYEHNSNCYASICASKTCEDCILRKTRKEIDKEEGK